MFAGLVDEFEELESELFDESEYDSKSVAGDLGTIIGKTTKKQSQGTFSVGDYSITLVENFSDWSGIEQFEPIRNQGGINHLIEHIDEVIEEQIQIDFQKRQIEIDDKEVSPTSKGWLLTPFIGIGLFFGLGEVGIVLGSIVCFCGFFPFIAVLLGTIVDPNNEYEAELNQEIERGGGIYRRGGISGIIHGLDVYFRLSIEHNDVEVRDAWEISPSEILEVFGSVYYEGGDSGYIEGRFNPQFTPRGQNNRVYLCYQGGRSHSNSKKHINRACTEAIEYAEVVRGNWQGPIILHSLPVIDEIENPRLFNIGSKEKKISKICSKITAENKKRLKEVYDEVKFL
ncbi:MAG: hypothetical protein CMA44_02450 [Euryarchaeota archaeon]|nr:hypothetical protein [Euryarchaeota archaeon]